MKDTKQQDSANEEIQYRDPLYHNTDKESVTDMDKYIAKSANEYKHYLIHININ